MAKSGILDAKNARGYAMGFGQDVEEKKYAKKCAEMVKNEGWKHWRS